MNAQPQTATRRKAAFWLWHKAASRKKRLQVATTDHAQEQARQLVRAGLCAYENRQGKIRDLGVPRRLEDAGRIFRNGDREGEEARDPT